MSQGANTNRGFEAQQVLEWALISGLLLDASRISHALSMVGPDDLLDVRLRPILEAMAKLDASGEPVDLVTIADQLDRSGKLNLAGGPQLLAEIADFEATAANLEYHLYLLKRGALSREARQLHERGAHGELDGGEKKRLTAVELEIEGLDAPGGNATGWGFTGARLEATRSRPPLHSPLPGLLDDQPSLHVIVGRAKTGKTTLACSLAIAWSQGISPYDRAPKLPGTRALIISAEQPLRRLDATLCRLDSRLRGSCPKRWPERVTIFARDPELSKAEQRLLTLDDDGLRLLRQTLIHARDERDAFGLIVLDSLSRLKPSDVEENDNDAMSAWLSKFEQLAEEQDVYILLVHHVGYSGRDEARTAGRGASAIAAVAQVLLLLEEIPGNPRQRRLKVQGNAVLSHEMCFEVADETSRSGEILYWRPVEPLEAYSVDMYLKEGEEISTSELARRLTGKGASKPSGTAWKEASRLRSYWERLDIVDTFPGPKGAIMLRRHPPDDEDKE